LPSIWYVIHLNAPGVNVMGASLPGSPAVISGFNDSIAWGVTNAQRDLVDWFKIEFKDKSKIRIPK
jgi:penicillin amidase